MKEEPQGELTIQVLAMPKDTNPAGDIFARTLQTSSTQGRAGKSRRTCAHDRAGAEEKYRRFL